MGSRTYETALNFEAKGLGWSYGDKPVFVKGPEPDPDPTTYRTEVIRAVDSKQPAEPDAKQGADQGPQEQRDTSWEAF